MANREQVRGTPRRKSSKAAILERFAELVADRGYDQTAISDIADELGISKGTIVHHYGSKQALLEQVHKEFMRRRLWEAQALVERLDSPVDQLSAIIYCLLLIHREDRNAALSFARELVRFAATPEMAEVRKLRDEYFTLVRDIVERGMTGGIFRQEDPTLITLQVFGMCNWSWTWIQPRGRRTIEEVAATFARILMLGLAVDGRGTDVFTGRNDRIPLLVRDLMRNSRENKQ